MQMFKFALAAFTIFTIAGCQQSLVWAQSLNPAASINICEGVASGMFLTDITNCSNYYLCENGQPIAQSCGTSLYFHEDTQSCNYDKSTCLACDPTKLSIHPLVKTCNKYVMCYAGQPIMRQCCDDLQVGTDAVCNLPSKVDCVANQCTLPNDPTNIVFLPSQADCGTYYICMSGVPVQQTCAKGLYFNPACNCCDLAANVNCTIVVPKSNIRRSATMKTHPEPQMVEIGCPETGILVYPHPNSNQYYMCVNGNGAIFTCAEGLFYDSHMQECRQLRNILLN